MEHGTAPGAATGQGEGASTSEGLQMLWLLVKVALVIFMVLFGIKYLYEKREEGEPGFAKAERKIKWAKEKKKKEEDKNKY